MLSALITFLQYFKGATGGQTTPLLKILKVLPKRYLCTKHAYLF